jgi:hypothetical protein
MPIAPTTELQAVNAMLSAIGEAPVADLVSPQPDVQRAINILEGVDRELQSQGWRFNTEFNFAVAGVASGAFWTFAVPANLLAFRLTTREDQYGFDALIRDGGFYDRINGTAEWSVDTLYIDPVWAVEWANLPSTARLAIVALATRRFAADMGAMDRVTVTEQDADRAVQLLQADQGAIQSQVTPWESLTSELTSLNTILASVGLDEAHSLQALLPFQARALNMLRRTSLEVQAVGWAYNYDHGIKLEPTSTEDGLNIFKIPEDPEGRKLIAWKVTPQSGQRNLLLATRELEGTGTIFYDRRKNQNGIREPFLWVDAVWYFNFADMPDVVRRYITTMATFRFAKTIPDGGERASLTVDDVRRAYREAHRQQGVIERTSFISNFETRNILGSRRDTLSFLPSKDYT